MAGVDNLQPVRSEDEAREKGRNGGIKSGESRRRKRDAKNAAKLILDLAPQQTIKDNLKALGVDVDDEEFTNRIAIFGRALTKAMTGDIGAMKFLIEMAGETPEQQLAEKRFKKEQDKDKPKSNVVEDWVNAVINAGKEENNG